MASSTEIDVQEIEKRLNHNSTKEKSAKGPAKRSSFDVVTDTLIVSEKGTLKWLGDFEGLKQLVEGLKITPAKWSTQGGSCKIYESDDISIRWYTTTNTVTLNGEKASEVKAELNLLVENERRKNSAWNDEIEDEDKIEENLHMGEAERKKSIGIPEGIKYNSNSDCELSLIELRESMANIAIKVEKLVDEMSSIKVEVKSPQISHEYVIEDLRQEIRQLKEENSQLMDRNANLSYIMSDLHTKVKDGENEKKSLITVINLLQPQPEREQSQDNREWQTVTRGNGKPRASVISQDPVIETNNKFDTLSLSDDDGSPTIVEEEVNRDMERKPQEARARKEQIKEPSRKKHADKERKNITSNTHKTGNDNKDTQGSATTVIIGDSITKYLDARRLKRSVKKGKQNIFVETYKGANTEAIKHHVKPSLARKPDRIILHVGTNDLRDNDAKKIIDNIAEICQVIKKESPTTKVVISELIHRGDKPEYAEMIRQVNKHIAKLCKRRNWDHLKHQNIQNKHLNSYGVHLNKSGTSVLAKNLIEFINSQTKD